MDDDYSPPTISEAFGDRGQTPPSTWSSRPSESYKPKPSAKIRGLIGRLGLRYHPANQADLSAHQAMLALLAEDVAHLDPDLLERAIDRHVATSPYMPKAADLIKLAQSFMAPRTSLDDYAEHLNALHFSVMSGRQWFVNTDAYGKRFLDCKHG